MGGGVMRTAASKTAASWAARSGMNRAGSSIGRRSSVPPPYAAVVEPGVISVQNGEAKGVDESGISQWEDDWEFTGWMEKEGGEELVLEPPPRLVFGPAPTIEEAKEATDDLKCALETAYFSEGVQESSKKNEQGHNGLFTNNPIIPAMPRGVMQAFSLLQSSPEAQSVVASLASDKAIWDAVMKNDKVMEFYRNNQSSLTENIFEDSSSKTNPTDNSDDNNNTFEEAPKGENGFVSFVTNMKEKAMEVVNNVSNLIQNVFGMKSDDEAQSSETGESNGGNKFMDFILTPHNTFLGLAIAVIFIVLLKRPGP